MDSQLSKGVKGILRLHKTIGNFEYFQKFESELKIPEGKLIIYDTCVSNNLKDTVIDLDTCTKIENCLNSVFWKLYCGNVCYLFSNDDFNDALKFIETIQSFLLSKSVKNNATTDYKEAIDIQICNMSIINDPSCPLIFNKEYLWLADNEQMYFINKENGHVETIQFNNICRFNERVYYNGYKVVTTADYKYGTIEVMFSIKYVTSTKNMLRFSEIIKNRINLYFKYCVENGRKTESFYEAIDQDNSTYSNNNEYQSITSDGNINFPSNECNIQVFELILKLVRNENLKNVLSENTVCCLRVDERFIEMKTSEQMLINIDFTVIRGYTIPYSNTCSIEVGRGFPYGQGLFMFESENVNDIKNFHKTLKDRFNKFSELSERQKSFSKSQLNDGSQTNGSSVKEDNKQNDQKLYKSFHSSTPNINLAVAKSQLKETKVSQYSKINCYMEPGVDENYLLNKNYVPNSNKITNGSNSNEISKYLRKNEFQKESSSSLLSVHDSGCSTNTYKESNCKRMDIYDDNSSIYHNKDYNRSNENYQHTDRPIEGKLNPSRSVLFEKKNNHPIATSSYRVTPSNSFVQEQNYTHASDDSQISTKKTTSSYCKSDFRKQNSNNQLSSRKTPPPLPPKPTISIPIKQPKINSNKQ